MLLEASRWKAGRKVLIGLRFLASRISLAGFGAVPWGSIGPGADRHPLCPQRQASILLHAATLDWPDFDPEPGAPPVGLRRSTSRR